MAYEPLLDKFGRILARCPQCHNLWKTDEAWGKVRHQAVIDSLHALDAMVNPKPSDKRLIDFVEGYNRALKDVKGKLSKYAYQKK